MTAAGTWLQVAASNLANAGDAAPPPGAGAAPFVPTRVLTVSLGANGVQAQLSAAPDMDPLGAMVDQMQALQQFRASAAVLQADDQMKQSALDVFHI